jgi:hypothetical protein
MSFLTISEKNCLFFTLTQGSQEGEGDDKGHMWPRLGQHMVIFPATHFGKRIFSLIVALEKEGSFISCGKAVFSQVFGL